VSRSDRILVACAGGAVVLAVAAGFTLLVPAGDAPAQDLAFGGLAASSEPGPDSAGTAPATPATIVVDVAGAVVRPGIVQLPAGTRVGDALSAAGGFSADADLDATAASLNLAQRLTDGEQIRVPRIGDTQAVAGTQPSGGSGGGGVMAGGGLIDLNTATPEQLQSLPGIGPVTAQKIVAARQEQPFSSLEDAQQRGVIHRGQLESIRELATAG
jgi:competence protein ComEA